MPTLHPFTPEQIRDASPQGRRYVFRVDAAGEPASWNRTTFVTVDSQGALLRMERWDVNSAPQKVGESRQTWAELHSHAGYPAARTTVEDGAHSSPLGPQRTRTYTTRGEDGELLGIATFAIDRPGPPLLMELHSTAGVQRRLTLEADEGGHFARGE